MHSRSETSETRMCGVDGGGSGSGSSLVRYAIGGGVSHSVKDAAWTIFTSEIWEYFSISSSLRISRKHRIDGCGALGSGGITFNGAMDCVGATGSSAVGPICHSRGAGVASILLIIAGVKTS